MKMKILTLSALLFTMLHGYSQDSSQAKPKYCILFIGDGFGVSAKTAARMAMGQGTPGKKFTEDAGFQILSLDKLRYNSMVTTHSANSWTTDSGPGASVYAAGENGKIDNESIAFNVADGESVETILEAAKKEGYATGLVTTTRITHATPAAFASHTWFRDLEDYIATQYLSDNQTEYKAIYNDPSSTIKPYNPSRDWQLPAPKVGVYVDVLLGGGFRNFYPNGILDTVRLANGQPVYNNGVIVTMGGKRTDNVNLINYAEKRGYMYVNSRDALLNIDTVAFNNNKNAKVIGLFNSSHMSFEQDRQLTNNWEPSLPEMVEMAIKLLKAKGGKKGFFLMVEGGRIDHLEHANTGAITVAAGVPNNVYTVDADKPVYVGGGEAVYSASPSTPRLTDIYGSDYLIKEVLAFDYAVAQGRKLLAEPGNKTLLFSTSDHECGGTAIVGLHDTYNAQNNGTYIRTYALGPRQNGIAASSSGAATATTVAIPTNLQRGDIDFGTTSPNGWYPNYTTYTFQGRSELWPKVDTAGRRIVVAYASNPVTNGNGNKAGGTPGNHTPMDIWVGADDNTGGAYASYITSKGLIDNTFLTPIMAKFLNLVYPFSKSSLVNTDEPALDNFQVTKTTAAQTLKVRPNPATSIVNLDFTVAAKSNYTIVITDMNGKVVKTSKGFNNSGLQSIQLNIAELTAGIYTARLSVITNGKTQDAVQKFVIQ